MGALQATETHQPQLTEYNCEETLEHKVSYTHARKIRGALSCAQGHSAHMRVDCWRACILGHLRANHGRAASYKPTNHNLQSMTVKKLWNTKYLTLMQADSGRLSCAQGHGAHMRVDCWRAHAFLATCAQITGALQATDPPTTTYRVWLWRNSGAQSILHWCAQIRDALSCAQGHGAHMRVDCWRACILGHLRANHGRAASFKPTNHNLQGMTVKKLWNTKYLTLTRADSGRAVMRARSRRAYGRRLLARMHCWPPARKSRACCKL